MEEETSVGVCRVCLETGGATASIFKEDQLGPKLAAIASFEISLNDPMPKTLCSLCCERLHAAFRLRQQAQLSDALLRQRYHMVKIEYPSIKYTEGWDGSHLEASIDSLHRDERETESVVDDFDRLSEAAYTIKTEIDPDYDVPIKKSLRKSADLERPTFPKIKKTSVDRRRTGERGKRARRKVIKEELTFDDDDDDDIKLNDLKSDRLQLIEKSELGKVLDVAFSDDLDVSKVGGKKCAEKKTRTGKKRTGPFTCSMCSLVFSLRRLFARHMRVEHKDTGFSRPKNHMCATCGNTFHDQHGLKMHERSHTGDRPHTCSICGQSFTQQCHMERHISAKHLKYKPFQCELCPKRFGDASTLRDHVRGHAGVRSHACDACGRRFLRRYALARHQLTHSRARPFLCLHCPRDYTQSNDLKAHVKRSHPGQPVDKLADYCVKQIKHSI